MGAINVYLFRIPHGDHDNFIWANGTQNSLENTTVGGIRWVTFFTAFSCARFLVISRQAMWLLMPTRCLFASIKLNCYSTAVSAHSYKQIASRMTFLWRRFGGWKNYMAFIAIGTNAYLLSSGNSFFSFYLILWHWTNFSECYKVSGGLWHLLVIVFVEFDWHLCHG